MPVGLPSSVAVPHLLPLHGVGGAKDLPIPAELAIAAGSAALVLSFTVLILAWRRPRYDVRTAGHPVPPGVARAIDSPVTRGALRAFGLVVAGYLLWPLLLGPDVVTNPVIGFFYVPLWVGIVPFSLLFGPAFRLVSPVRTLHLLLSRAAGRDPARGLRDYPARLGYWPAALGLFAFVWQELVNPSSTYLDSIRLWLALYLAITLAGAMVFGEVWLRRADPFEVYSELVGRLAVIGRRPATDAEARRGKRGPLVFRSPLAGLDGTPTLPGLVAVLAVLFGSTAFDSYKDQLRWISFVDSQPLPEPLVDTAALLVAVAAVGISFSLAALATGARPTYPRSRLPALLVHAVVPIVVGYMTAHYLSYFVEQGQVVLMQLSDPMVDGSNLLGTANGSVHYWLSLHPTFLATVKVLAIVLGHVTGAVAAHDRALRLLPPKHQVTGQLAMLVLMVAYTATGLYLLFGA